MTKLTGILTIIILLMTRIDSQVIFFETIKIDSLEVTKKVTVCDYPSSGRELIVFLDRLEEGLKFPNLEEKERFWLFLGLYNFFLSNGGCYSHEEIAFEIVDVVNWYMEKIFTKCTGIKEN